MLIYSILDDLWIIQIFKEYIYEITDLYAASQHILTMSEIDNSFVSNAGSVVNGGAK